MRSMVEGECRRVKCCVDVPLRQGCALPPPRTGEDRIALYGHSPGWVTGAPPIYHWLWSPIVSRS